MVRGRYVLSKIIDRHHAEIIESGAVVQRNGLIVDIGTYEDMAAKYQADEVLGSPDDIVLPGFVNGHHHVGLTPVQLGSRDEPLELWFATRLCERDVDPYLDTLYSAFEMLESGITTVQHLQSWLPRPVERISNTFDRILGAYADIGMRVSFSYFIRDQNRMAYQDDSEFLASLPDDVRVPLTAHFQTVTLSLEEQLDLIDHLFRKYDNQRRIRIQLAPANLHWCSDLALQALRERSQKYGAPMHMHLLESAFQKEYAFRRAGVSAVEHLHRNGLLGPQMTLGHGVWLNERDADLVGETCTNICHNASSNLRLRSGIAPLNEYEKRGVKVAIGIDEAVINDDRDMLQEMRLVLNLHRVPGMDDSVPTPEQVFRMATSDGAHTTCYCGEIGSLEVGKAADIVVMDWRHVSYPFLDLDHDVSVLEAVLHRGRAAGIKTVIVDGEPVIRDRNFTRINKADALEELANSLKRPLNEGEITRRHLSRAMVPHMRNFFANYLSPRSQAPFYQQNGR